MSLKDSWKQTGVGLGHAFRDLGKSMIKSVAVGVKKADDWAHKEEKASAEQAQPENPFQPEEQQTVETQWVEE